MIDFTTQTNLVKTIEQARPNIPTDAYMLVTAIARMLGEILDKTSTVSLSADYEYVLESLAANDVPDSLNTYIRFPKENPKLVKEMENLLLEQLATIVESITNIKNEIEEQMLATMKTHSRYIKDKFASTNITDNVEETDGIFTVTNTTKRAKLETETFALPIPKRKTPAEKLSAPKKRSRWF